MFSNENRRFTVLVIAMVSVAIGTIISMTSMINRDHGKDTMIVSGFTGLLITHIIGMIRAEQARKTESGDRKKVVEASKESAQAVHEAKSVVQEAKKVVATAAATPVASQLMMPQNPGELRQMIHDIVAEFSDETCTRVATEAASKAAEASAVREAGILRTINEQIELLRREFASSRNPSSAQAGG